MVFHRLDGFKCDMKHVNGKWQVRHNYDSNRRPRQDRDLTVLGNFEGMHEAYIALGKYVLGHPVDLYDD
eukprot:g26020.t1